MNYLINRFTFLVVLVLLSFANSSLSQIVTDTDNIEIKAINGISGKRLNCFPTNNLIVSKQEFEKLLNDERCSNLNSFEVDFSKHTLINFSIGGDCHMRVAQNIFRNDKTKTYTIEVKNYWGGCRAGGFYHSWNVIDKIPAGYKVELKEIKLDKREKDSTNLGGSTTPLPKPPAILYGESIDLKGCIPMYRQKRFIIKDKETYLKNIRNDAQTPQCKTNAENLDFEKYSILGIQINSGYCRYPKGLQHKLLKDITNKKYVLKISYIDPGNETCRALSRYDLWLQVPKLQDDYEVVFKIEPRQHKSSS